MPKDHHFWGPRHQIQYQLSQRLLLRKTNTKYVQGTYTIKESLYLLSPFPPKYTQIILKMFLSFEILCGIKNILCLMEEWIGDFFCKKKAFLDPTNCSPVDRILEFTFCYLQFSWSVNVRNRILPLERMQLVIAQSKNTIMPTIMPNIQWRPCILFFL